MGDLERIGIEDPAALMAATSRLLTLDDGLRPRLTELYGHVADYIAAAGSGTQASEATSRLQHMYDSLGRILQGLSVPMEQIVQAINETGIGVERAGEHGADAIEAIDVDLSGLRADVSAVTHPAGPSHGGGRH
ncbi:hypothetical protein KZZ52_27940 [Dactylosporangium sp. AC04546]|uniref:hypothetical protein n=1 Tax=Dactylosporangium sp. AC04546 TaxID=2862460 RepID=UPI001EDDD6B0|nr:hypothetical protein [Dactylosporangium sp. AC04546]WVK89099.1 hypothetical protein KZZ52_27940 [Dactylosporangium sp. AC04546]